MMGGRIAEEIMFGDVTSGAQNDLKTATNLAHKMVCEWGMSEKLGPMTFGEREEHIFLGREISRSSDYSESTAIEIDREVRKIIDECYAKANKLILDNKEKLIKIASYLLEREVLSGEEISKIVRGEILEDMQAPLDTSIPQAGSPAASPDGGEEPAPAQDPLPNPHPKPVL